MKPNFKKMIAPIVVSLVVTAFYIAYFCIVVFMLDGVWKYLLGIIPLALAVLMIKMCIERIKEIKRGEEDDIGKY